MRRVDHDGYYISDDKSKLNLDAILAMLQGSYWAHLRKPEATAKAITHSLCYGVYDPEHQQIGFARVVTDYATMYYVCDVIVDERWRGRGVGKALVAFILADDSLQGLNGFLGTKDAHGLYESYGFIRDPERFLRRPAP